MINYFNETVLFLLKVIKKGNKNIEYNDFLSFYQIYSALYDDDEYFANIIKYSWILDIPKS